MQKKVLIVGPFLPPVGGVSVHIDRLAYLLKKTHDVTFIDDSDEIKPGIPNLRTMGLKKYLASVAQSEVIHIHSGIRLLLYFHIIVGKLLGKNIVLTIHSYKENSILFQFVDRLVYSLPDITVVVSDSISEKLRLRNMNLVKDAFLPPIVEKEPPIPDPILRWLKNKNQLGYRIAAGNASRLVIHNGEDLYGLDICIQAAFQLKKQQARVAFIFIVCTNDGDIEVTTYEEQIKEMELEQEFLIVKMPLSFINLIANVDVVLRPTNTDGDALTVREALYFKKPVVASDVVTRPAPVYLFKSRSSEALASAILKALNENQKSGGAAIREVSAEIYSDFSLLYAS